MRYYDQDLALAKDLQDKMNMGRAYCNLGLAHLALGQLETSLECQKYFLAIAHMTNNLAGKFRALGNIGDVLIKMEETEEAVKMYHRQLALARSNRDRGMEAAACGALGIAHRLLKRLDKALGECSLISLLTEGFDGGLPSRLPHSGVDAETGDVGVVGGVSRSRPLGRRPHGPRELHARREMLSGTAGEGAGTAGLRRRGPSLRKSRHCEVNHQKPIY